MPSRTDIAACFVTGCLALAVGAAGAAPPGAGAAPPKQAIPSRIDFTNSLDLAKALVVDAPKPIVVQFGATWCGWCRKLETETFRDPTVLAMAPKFVWVHVDVDEQPAIASAFGARALPYAAIIDADGRVLAESRGFTDGKGYSAFLARGEAAFVPVRSGPIEAAAVPDRVRGLVETMAPATSTGRTQCVDALRRLGAASLPALVAMLADERLAVRAAAGFALVELSDSDIGFDPLAPAPERAERVRRWQAWLATDAAKALRPAPQPAPPPVRVPAPAPAGRGSAA